VSGLPARGGMYRYGLLVYRFRWFVVTFWVAAVLASLPFALKSPSVLQGGGYFTISGQATDVEHILSRRLHQPLSQVVVVFQSATLPAAGLAYRHEIRTFTARARGFPYVTSVMPGGPGRNGRTAYVLVGFDRDPDYMQREMSAFRALLPTQDTANPAQAFLTGTPAVYDTLTRITVRDAERADATALPIALIVMLVVFGTAVAAMMPLLLGLAAVPTALAIIYLIALHQPMTSFILSIASIIGLGISIDYSLLITRRFREELGRPRQPHRTGPDATIREAVAATTATAGRSILFSGIIVMIGFLGLLAIGVQITTSFAIGGAVVVATAVLAAQTLLPALLGILGTRVNAVRIPFLEPRPGSLSRLAQSPGASDTSTASAAGRRGFWHAWALAVMRRPWTAILSVVVLIAFLAWPALALKVGVPGTDVLPGQASERQGLAILQEQFPALAEDPIYVVAQVRSGGRILAPGNLQEVGRLTTWIAAQRHVTGVTGLTRLPATPGTRMPSTSQLIALYASGGYRQVPAVAQFASSVAAGDTTVIVVRSNTTLESAQGKALIEHLRSHSAAAGPRLDISVGGLQALSLDLDSALYRNFPRTILVILATTYILLLLMFRSVLLPLKAVLMNTLSVGATYGALVYIFQWGNLGFPRVAFIDAIIPILLFCILFGLSMDYEVFLLSRVREEWLQTKDNRIAVASGLEKTAGVITSAACLFVIVTGAFIFASLVTTREIGVGITVAVLVDATCIRLLLVPATMRLLGRWNWWLPGRPVPPSHSARWSATRRSSGR
jgi:putative drug exporter of the RND superfamily